MKKALLLLSFTWLMAGCTANATEDGSGSSALTAGSGETSTGEAKKDATKKRDCRRPPPPRLECHGEITPPSESCIDLKKLHDAVLEACKEHKEILAGFHPVIGPEKDACAAGSAKAAKFVCCLPPPPPPPPPPPRDGDEDGGDGECEGGPLPPPPPPGAEGGLPPPPPEGEDGKLPPPPPPPEGEDGKLPPPPPPPEAG